MTKIYQTQRVTVPAAFVCKSKQRVKQINEAVYLKNGDEFEIELFNPTTNKILAKISLNGKSLGSGIVLRPGERVFLERYFDEAKKFLFETYEVDSNDANVREAIKMNGIVEVEFFDEYKPITITYTYSPPTWTYYNSVGTCCQSNSIPIYGNASYTSGNLNTIKTSSVDAHVFDCCADINSIQMAASGASAQPLETGRVEKGSTSNQSFMNDSTTFNSWYSWKSKWQIMPESQRPLFSEDLKYFCTNCGARRKKSSHKFCPNCGKKF